MRGGGYCDSYNSADDKDDKEKYAKLVIHDWKMYLQHWNNYLQLWSENSREAKKSEKKTADDSLQFLFDEYPQFADLKPQEDPVVQKVLDEIAKAPGSSMPKAITVSNDAPPKIGGSSPAPAPQQSGSSSAPASSAPAQQSDTEQYRQKAEKGNVGAQYSYGYRLYSGNGVEKNVAEGIKWMTKAAEQGHGTA
jgi:TPR repeat protein